MRIDILSLFPEMFTGPLTESIVGKAVEKGILDIEVTNFRDYTTDRQNHVDDYPTVAARGCYCRRSQFLMRLMRSNKKRQLPGRSSFWTQLDAV